MTQRKEVFKSKVLQKLYPAAPTLEKKPSPPRIVEALANKTHVRKKAFQGDTTAGQTQGAAIPSPRIYTVLPPPEDYKKHLGKPVPIPQLESINTARNPADESVHERSDEELKQGEEQRNGRRRKRKLRQDGAAAGSESGAGQNQTETAVDGGEHVSRNKKRKLKKKRHKEKLVSMGVMPRAAALVFTYEKTGEKEEEEEEEEEEDHGKRAAEVSDFLRTTLEIYVSDSQPHIDKRPLLPGTVENLLSRISSGCKPNAALMQLYNLKACVQQKEVDKLEKALKELPNSLCMSAEETAAVTSLFQYWITDILPMHGDETTRLSTAHP